MNNTWKVYMHIFPNNKKYIGITKMEPEKRWLNGKGYTKCGTRNSSMANAVNKYGWDNIKHLILFENLTFEEANKKEKQLISLYKTNCCRYGNKYGYNSTDGGDGQYGHKMSLEARKKLSENHKGLLTGKNHPQSKPVICENKEYCSISEFASSFGLKREAVKAWLNGRNNMPIEWYEKGLKYRDIITFIKPQERPHKRKVSYDGITFDSLTKVSEYIGEDFRKVSLWLLGKNKMPKRYMDKGLKYI